MVSDFRIWEVMAQIRVRPHLARASLLTDQGCEMGLEVL